MISMDGVPSVLIAKNQSWVRKQAQALVRHLPANVERADLIQVGLIAVAQAAVTFDGMATARPRRPSRPSCATRACA
jgi:RNA polymerase sigma factor for flagellar operon FliA